MYSEYLQQKLEIYKYSKSYLYFKTTSDPNFTTCKFGPDKEYLKNQVS